MTLKLVHDSEYKNANTFTKQPLLNTATANTETERDHARVIVHHRAPDLYNMIFGGAA